MWETHPGKKGLEQVLCSFPFYPSPYQFSCLCTGDDYYSPNQPQAPQGETGFTDGSGPLFSMYLERAREKDEKMADRWKADADGILVFVSEHSGMPLFACCQLKIIYRPVCFLPQLRHLSESLSRTLGQTLKTPPRSILPISIRYSPILTGPTSSSLPHYPLHPNSLRLRPLSGSTLSGS